jgi:hypothetical protein
VSTLQITPQPFIIRTVEEKKPFLLGLVLHISTHLISQLAAGCTFAFAFAFAFRFGSGRPHTQAESTAQQSKAKQSKQSTPQHSSTQVSLDRRPRKPSLP